MKIEPLARLERHARRIGEIVTILGKYGLAEAFGTFDQPWLKKWLRSEQGQPLTSLSQAERIRQALTEMGATFIKLGQTLSTRADLIGPSIAQELTRLQSQVPPESATQARATIKEAFGCGVGELFTRFDDTPLAAASMAQVHRAVLTTGENVVVKIRRSRVTTQVTTDLEILAGLAAQLERHSPALRRYQPAAIAEQFSRTLSRELDFTNERRNLEEFARNFADDETVHVPTVFPDYCAPEVLTLEYLDGIVGTDKEALDASGQDLATFASRGATMYLNMVFRDGFYHADPHPGNLLLLPEVVVGVIDCGMVGRLDDILREDVEALLLAIFENDTERVTDQVFRLGSVPPDLPRDRLRSDLQDLLNDYLGRPLDEIDIGAALTTVIEIVRRHQIILPPPLAVLLRTLIVLEGTSRRFHPAFSLAELIRPFCTRMVLRHLTPERLMKRLRRSYRDWDRFFTLLPRDLSDLITRFRDGSLTVHLDHRHLDPVVNRLVLGILTAALFLGSSMLWSRQAPPLLGGISIVGALGFLVATFLGFRLLAAIRNSGNIRSKD
ncbi:MAG: phosphotransferase [Verrucomicrobiales bacterium]|nr:phosphotransferase [Verrucomicrobiales bacterium]